MPKSALALVLLASVAPFSAVLPVVSSALADEAELPGADTQFLAKAIVSGRGEVELSQLATSRAASPEVKQFAEHMVKDHTAMNAKLMAEAQRHKIKAEGTYGTPPLQPSRQAQMTKEQLEKLSGAEFDKAFIQRLIRDHEMDIAQFQEEAKNGKDTATRDLADSALPTLQEHLRQAREIGARAGQS